MHFTILALVLTVAGHIVYAEPKHAEDVIYRYQDDDVTVFTDVPRKEKDKPVTLSPLQSYQLPHESTKGVTNKKPIIQLPQRKYQVHILKPTQEETIWSGSGDVEVDLTIGKLLKGEKFHLKLDDEVIMSGNESGTYVIKNIYRGTRVLEVDIVNRDGDVLYSSKPVTFYMHRPFR